MRCHLCFKEIDLELTEEEESDIINIMQQFNVCMVCIECSNITKKVEEDPDILKYWSAI